MMHRQFILVVCCLLILTSTKSDASDEAVVWINRVNVTVTGDLLQKIAGCDGCEDAGATSQQALSNGDGYID